MCQAELLPTLVELFRVKRLLKLDRVNADRINAQGGIVPVAWDVGELRLDPQEPLDGAAEIPQIPKGVKPNPVRAQHSRHQFAAARMATENLVSGKGRVQEKPNSEVGGRRSQHCG